MKTKIMKIIRPLILMLMTMVGVSAWAADAPASPLIAEIWTCSYKDGKDVSDVLKARDFMVSKADRVGLKLPTAFLWDLRKGDAPINYVWFNVHRNIGAFGASADALEISGIGPDVSERFSSVSDCVAGMGTAQMILSQGDAAASVLDDGPLFLAAESCSYINGASQENLTDLIAHMQGVMKGMGDNAPAFSSALEPFTLSAPGAPDVILYSGYENATGWSNYALEMMTTEAGKSLRNHMNKVLDCGGLTIWSSQQVVWAAK